MDNPSTWAGLVAVIITKPGYAGMAITIVSGISLIILYCVTKKRKSSPDDIFSVVIKRFFFWLPLAFLLGMVITLTSQISSCATNMKQDDIFEALTSEEKVILHKFREKGVISLLFKHNQKTGVLASLVKKGVLYKAAETSKGFYIYYNITDWAWDYLRNHPELIGINE